MIYVTGHLLKLFTLSNSMTVHVQEPTCIMANSVTIIDQIISNVPSLIRTIEALDPVSNCDHCPVKAALTMRNNCNKPKAFHRHVRDYKLADPEEFKNQLQNANWNSCFQHENSNNICEAWTATFLNTACECIPN